MSEFKFEIGDEVWNDCNMRVDYRYITMNGDKWYICSHGILESNGRVGWHFGEKALRYVPKKPLDSNGEEIEVGDLVTGSVGTVAKVRAIKLDHSFPIRVFELKFKRTNGYTIKGTTILEKAPKQTITLGSLVRVKETGEEFRVIKGELGDRNFKCWTREISWEEHRVYKEYELELIG